MIIIEILTYYQGYIRRVKKEEKILSLIYKFQEMIFNKFKHQPI